VSNCSFNNFATWSNSPCEPVIINSDFARRFIIKESVELLDNINFRGYLSFCELALRSYANNYGVLLTTQIVTKERDDYLLRYSDSMKT
jgi:hypothetical protein